MIIFSLLVLDNVDFFEMVLVILFLKLDVVLKVVEVLIVLLGRARHGPLVSVGVLERLLLGSYSY